MISSNSLTPVSVSGVAMEHYLKSAVLHVSAQIMCQIQPGVGFIHASSCLVTCTQAYVYVSALVASYCVGSLLASFLSINVLRLV